MYPLSNPFDEGIFNSPEAQGGLGGFVDKGCCMGVVRPR